MKAVRSVGILGAGAGGLMAALALRRQLPELEVEVIASASLPPIGVGESTLLHIVDFLHDYLGLDRSEFYRRVRPTWKLGVRLEGWGPPGLPRYHFPFERIDHAGAHGDGPELTEASLLGVLMEAGKSHIVPAAEARGGHRPARGKSHAYHLENRSFIAHLMEVLERRGVTRTDARIESVERSESGAVSRLVATDGRTFEHDLYLDCSGFRSFLLGGALDVPWVDFGSSHFTDHALLATAPNAGRPLPYTTARTLRSGWVWRIPMQDEDHFGYVFSGAHCSVEEAARELADEVGVEPEEHVLRFPTGRHERPWHGNVVAVGNAFAFVEPLESSALQMVLRGVVLLVETLASGGDLAAGRKRYNEVMNRKWDALRGIIALHYRCNRRLDTPFWRDCADSVDLVGAEPLLEHFRSRGLLTLADPTHPGGSEALAFLGDAGVFGTSGIDIILLGQGEQPGGGFPVGSPESHGWFRRKRKLWRDLARRALPHRAALEIVAARPGLMAGGASAGKEGRSE